ncbi:Crp/Fnr family transcriptional regulator [uncultured Desulfuromusa sp.]|uniref:Crp/Fnr family transcriptional regulator n=1 Tax=uncultured Desulfuromusa sp. TaxID=219183 RepID=UPI002AA889FB|nr:Crp/Fnr family transcriptional regulator [uncultured Desulfuromusa sp.]
MGVNFSDIIKQCHLFSGVTAEDLPLLTAILRKREFSKGKILFEEGSEADGFYIVASGKVKVYKLSSEGKERILHVVQPGNSFAEAAIFDNGCYPAFAETLVPASLLFFPKREFLDLLHRHPQLAINIISGLSRFLREFTIQIEDLTFRDVPARLARYLLSFGGDVVGEVELPVSKSQLASNLGTTSETLSRTLRKFSDDETVSVRGKKIEILDWDRLQDLAERFKEA